MGVGSAEVTRLPAVAEDGFPPRIVVRGDVLSRNDDLKVVVGHFRTNDTLISQLRRGHVSRGSRKCPDLSILCDDHRY